VRILEIFWQ